MDDALIRNNTIHARPKAEHNTKMHRPNAVEVYKDDVYDKINNKNICLVLHLRLKENKNKPFEYLYGASNKYSEKYSTTRSKDANTKAIYMNHTGLNTHRKSKEWVYILLESKNDTNHYTYRKYVLELSLIHI